MNWRRLLIVLFWVIVIGLLAKEWYASHVTLPPPAPPVVKKPAAPQFKGPILTIKDQKLNEIDQYHFSVHYTLANEGDRPAKTIHVYITPWKHAIGPGSTDLKTIPIDPALPILKDGKYDVITKLAPGESVTREVNFDGVAYAVIDPEYLPPDIFTIKFETE